MSGATEAPIEGMTTKPYGIADAPSFFGPMWLACVMWAAGDAETVSQFEAETKMPLGEVLRAKGINRLIDESSGRTRATVVAFADWVTKNLWGEDEEVLTTPRMVQFSRPQRTIQSQQPEQQSCD